ncbi:hypothetical protein D0X99_00815 [Algoriphagus lacus]|uniref:Uncharacterized protein n=1 Tax=Algoriphagus lacus TaxID=2056311 RepID=A0A418PW47_9BACT|nr:DUF6090 family protein [Algoriphagus lacus]RIW18272.1 hypothetical protein D0X99_00815 [Algoriphagus lacus]
MITFFRKIRQKLLSQNRVTRYIAYALGEIFLVTIGILIALQVNTWNEQRKTKIKAYSYLQRLNEDMEIALKDTEGFIMGNERHLKNSIIVKNAMETKKLSSSDQVNFDQYVNEYHMFYMTLASLSTYEEMSSGGELNLIQSRWIRDAFINLSEYRDFILEVNRTYHDSELMKTGEFQKYVRYTILHPGTDSSKVTPSYDFELMAADPSLINKVSRQSVSWNEILGMFKGYKFDVSRIRDSIQSEVKKYH